MKEKIRKGGGERRMETRIKQMENQEPRKELEEKEEETKIAQGSGGAEERRSGGRGTHP